MAYTLTVELHPLGVVVQNDEDGRELLIEGESCCGISYEELKRIALTNRRVDVEDANAYQCRLKRPPPEC
jgi:hypothetical protein